MSRLGDTIKAARLKSGLSAKALGKKCGVAEKFIIEVESGARIVADEQAQRILKALGATNPVSTELEVASEPDRPLRPRPRPYVLPAEPEAVEASRENADAWLDALGGVLRRVPVLGPDGEVIEHKVLPVTGGKIEGGTPDKVLYFRCPDNLLRGFRVHAGDLLLTVPESAPVDDAIMLVLLDGARAARKVKKLDGNKLLLQTYEYEFSGRTVERKDVPILGRCVRLERTL